MSKSATNTNQFTYKQPRNMAEAFEILMGLAYDARRQQKKNGRQYMQRRCNAKLDEFMNDLIKEDYLKL
jgi:hypothetical protein